MLEVIRGEKEEEKIDLTSVEAREKREEVYLEREALLSRWACGINVAPPWCVYGYGEDGGYGIIYWIKPGDDAAFAAQQISKLTNGLGGYTKVRRTEYHPEGEDIAKEATNDILSGHGTETMMKVPIERMCKSELESSLRSALIYRAEPKEEVAWEVYETTGGKKKLLYQFPKWEEGPIKQYAEDVVKILTALGQLKGDNGQFKVEKKRHLRAVSSD